MNRNGPAAKAPPPGLRLCEREKDAGRPRPKDPLLEVNNIEVIYNHVILVLKGVSLSVPRGGITALLGGNGAGKTTTLKAISNLLHSERGEVTKGTIRYKGETVHGRDPADLVKKGVIQVMEGRHCFQHLTVEENLMTGAYTRRDGKAAIEADLQMVYDYFPRLQGAAQVAGRIYLGRRAADVRHRARAHVAARDGAAGRAQHGSGAATGRADLRDREVGERERGSVLPARRAEHQRRAALSRIPATSSNRAAW